KIFSDTWGFYYDLIWDFDYMLRGRGPYGRELTYPYDYETGLRSKCRKFQAAVGEHDQGDVAIRSLVGLMGPTCVSPPPNSSIRSECEQLARTLSLNGGTSNRCFQNFVIRYRNYSALAYESIVDVVRYLYRD
ncbi:hypothetical protein AAVH_29687, partial [Aphelenchoides avenae]